jgi:hypothetical protein
MDDRFEGTLGKIIEAQQLANPLQEALKPLESI